MLSLPLPQSIVSSKVMSNAVNPKPPRRRSLYANLILNNAQSIKNITVNTSSFSQPSSNYFQFDRLDSNELSKSKFYVSDNVGNSYSNGLIDSQSAPYHVKIGVNIHVSNDNSNARDLINLNDTKNSSSTVINPDFNDLKTYFKNKLFSATCSGVASP